MRLHAAVQAVGALTIFAIIGVCDLYVTKSTAQSSKEGQPHAESNGSPIYGVTIPAGYRDWRLISVKQIGQRYCDNGFSGREAPVPRRRNRCRAALE